MDKLCGVLSLWKLVEQPITEEDANIEQQAIKEFECPVCRTYITPPIFMCKNSHVICLQCWDKCTVCPTCRGPKSFTRALTLEKIHPMLSFPCKFDGCSFRANGSFTQEHELICKFFPIKCPLSDAYECTWNGPVGHTRGHLIQNHRSNIYFDPGVRFVSSGFRYCRKRAYTLIFYCYERIFRLTWEFDCEKSPVAVFSMVQIGNRNRHESFQYTVAFSKHFPIRSGNKRAFVMQSGIPKDNQNIAGYNPEGSSISKWGISFNHLVTFCTRPNGDLYYEVIIRRQYGAAQGHEVLSLHEYESMVED